MKHFVLFSSFFLIWHAQAENNLITFTTIDKDSTTKEIIISFVVPQKDFIYKDFITCSVNEPSVQLSRWQANKQSTSSYDPYFNDTKHIFTEDFSISMVAIQNDCCRNPIHLHCSYYRKADNKPNDILFTFSFQEPLETHLQIDDADIIIEPQAKNNNSPHHHIYRHPLEEYYAQSAEIIKGLSRFFATNHKKCFYLLIILTALFLFFFTVYQERLRVHKKWYETIEMTLFLCAIMNATYVLSYLYLLNNPIGKLLATHVSVLFLAFTAMYALKKSTKISSESLRTLYTFIGMISMSAMLISMFKAIQYAEKYL